MIVERFVPQWAVVFLGWVFKAFLGKGTFLLLPVAVVGIVLAASLAKGSLWEGVRVCGYRATDTFVVALKVVFYTALGALAIPTAVVAFIASAAVMFGLVGYGVILMARQAIMGAWEAVKAAIPRPNPSAKAEAKVEANEPKAHWWPRFVAWSLSEHRALMVAELTSTLAEAKVEAVARDAVSLASRALKTLNRDELNELIRIEGVKTVKGRPPSPRASDQQVRLAIEAFRKRQQ